MGLFGAIDLVDGIGGSAGGARNELAGHGDSHG